VYTDVRMCVYADMCVSMCICVYVYDFIWMCMYARPNFPQFHNHTRNDNRNAETAFDIYQ
jgi:hypothetical protein